MKLKPQSTLLLGDPPSDNSHQECDKLHPLSKGDLLISFPTLTLKELGNAALMDRQETKFVLLENKLGSLLFSLESEYHILEIQSKTSFQYQSVYLDTPNRILYHQHQSGTRPRWKIRLRTYLDTGISFLEVKQKDNRDQTHKTRQRIEEPISSLLKIHKSLQGTTYPGNITALKPVLETYYQRMTLIHNDKKERITIDRQLSFTDNKKTRSLSELVVVEVKQERFNPRSPFLIQLKRNGVQPVRFSKYCLGSLLLDPTLKHNRFKPIFHQINPLLTGGSPHEWIL